MAKTRKRIAFTAWGVDEDIEETRQQMRDKANGFPWLFRTKKKARMKCNPGETPVKLRIEEIDHD